MCNNTVYHLTSWRWKDIGTSMHFTSTFWTTQKFLLHTCRQFHLKSMIVSFVSQFHPHINYLEELRWLAPGYEVQLMHHLTPKPWEHSWPTPRFMPLVGKPFGLSLCILQFNKYFVLRMTLLKTKSEYMVGSLTTSCSELQRPVAASIFLFEGSSWTPRQRWNPWCHPHIRMKSVLDNPSCNLRQPNSQVIRVDVRQRSNSVTPVVTWISKDMHYEPPHTVTQRGAVTDQMNSKPR